MQTGSDKAHVDDGEGFEDTGTSAVFHGLHKNTVTVVIVDNKDIVVAHAGGNNEPLSLA